MAGTYAAVISEKSDPVKMQKLWI